ncbi:MAG: SRPBCC family protein [Actinobacteria bacterium]|nr:SRPBCC family protein [Ilumatobacteraceae bacterium]NMD25583.1 SRPBCC family protein [Actinomycetota bacterium]
MTSTSHSTVHDAAHDSQLDLRLQRTVDIAPELVWAAWTQPEHLTKWFTPSAWTTPEAEVDLRPGGIFRTVMCSPDGDRVDSSGCYLEVVENRRLVWTAALGPGYRPNDFSGGGFPFTAILTLEPAGAGTLYTARVMHAAAEQAASHAEMGFVDGWGAALDQLVAYMRGR